MKKPLSIILGLLIIFVAVGLLTRTSATDSQDKKEEATEETLSDLHSYNEAKELAINTCSPIIAWVVGQQSGMQQHSGKITKILSSEYSYWNLYGDGDGYEWQRFEFFLEMKISSSWEHAEVKSKVYRVVVGQACQVEDIIDLAAGSLNKKPLSKPAPAKAAGAPQKGN